MNLYLRQFDEDLNLPAMTPRQTILIASTPRCGSHMIAHSMTRSGLLGVPFEYLNPANLAHWSRLLNSGTPEQSLELIMARRTSANGVFGIKAHFEHCRVVGGPAKLFDLLPELTVVHLRRADVMRQAISYAIARQTGVWISGQDATADDAFFDPDLIQDCLNDIALQNAHWASGFAAAGITPINLYYEDVGRDIAASVTTVARFAGVLGTGESIEVETPTRKQSQDARTEEWIKRYAAERQRQSMGRGFRQRLARVIGQ